MQLHLHSLQNASNDKYFLLSDLFTYFIILLFYSVERKSSWWWLHNRQSHFWNWTRVSIQLNQSSGNQQRLKSRLLFLLLAECVEFHTSELDYAPTPERKMYLCFKPTDIILRNFSLHTQFYFYLLKRIAFNADASFCNPNLCLFSNDDDDDDGIMAHFNWFMECWSYSSDGRCHFIIIIIRIESQQIYGNF